VSILLKPYSQQEHASYFGGFMSQAMSLYDHVKVPRPENIPREPAPLSPSIAGVALRAIGLTFENTRNLARELNLQEPAGKSMTKKKRNA